MKRSRSPQLAERLLRQINEVFDGDERLAKKEEEEYIATLGQKTDSGDEAAREELFKLAHSNGIDPEKLTGAQRTGLQLASLIIQAGGEEDGEERMEQELAEVFESNGWEVQTFETAGVMNRNKGLVVQTDFGKFQVTIVEDRRGY